MVKLPLPDEPLNRVTRAADNKPVRNRAWGRWAALLSAAVLAGGIPRSATATDIEALRTEARSLGAHVSELETELASLNQKAEGLRLQMESTSRKIGLLELEKDELDEAHERALSRYVSRAVTAYKEGPGAQVELLLGARSVSELLTLAETQM